MQAQAEQTYFQKLLSALTIATTYRVDFFNIGGLSRLRTLEGYTGLWTHYSWRELMVRGGMVTASLVAGIYGGLSDNPEEGFSWGSACTYGASTFFVTHLAAIQHTVWTRNQLVRGEEVAFSRVSKIIHELELQNTEFSQLVCNIHNYSLPVNARGDGPRNLMYKQNIMENIEKFLQQIKESDAPETLIEQFLGKEIEALITIFKKRDFMESFQELAQGKRI